MKGKVESFNRNQSMLPHFSSNSTRMHAKFDAHPHAAIFGVQLRFCGLITQKHQP